MHTAPARATVPRLSRRAAALLTLLSQRALSGLEILDATETAPGRPRVLGLGSLSRTLSTLEKKGLLRSWWGDALAAERGHAPPRYYTATALGEHALAVTSQRRSERHTP